MAPARVATRWVAVERVSTANGRSLRLAARLGFQPVGTFEQFDAEQTLGRLASLHSFRE